MNSERWIRIITIIIIIIIVIIIFTHIMNSVF